MAKQGGTDRFYGEPGAGLWQIMAVRTDLRVEVGAEPEANQGGTDRFGSDSELIFEQIRAVRTEFAVTIE